jgi:hypothetical protein
MREIIESETLKIMSAENLKIIELSRTIKTWAQALRTSINISGLSDDQVRLELDIDKGNFSRMLSGQANFPIDRLNALCRTLGHSLPLYWIGYQGGFDLIILPKTLEKELEKERLEKEKALERVAYLEELLLRQNGGK